MKLSKSAHDFYVPDGVAPRQALQRTTHLGIGAHQDDLEFFAAHGILTCFSNEDRWFTGITVTDGAGSARAGAYQRFNDEEMVTVRRIEQRKAAMLGEYAAMIQLGYPSREIKELGNPSVIADLHKLLASAQPEVVYLHNPADKHDTHLAVLEKSIAAIRQLPKEQRPKTVYGCEIWRDLDWLPDNRKIALSVSKQTNLQAALNGVFDSQITGGKRYDLAVMGRRLSHATFYDSHSIDQETGLIFAIDLTPLCQDDALSIEAFTMGLVEEFANDVRDGLQKFTRG